MARLRANVSQDDVFQDDVPKEGVQTIRLASLKSTVNITTHKDSSSGQEIVLWSDVLMVFREAIYLQHGSMALSFLKDANFRDLDPLRIAAIPGATLDVVIEGQTPLRFAAEKRITTPRVRAQKSIQRPPLQDTRRPAEPQTVPQSTHQESFFSSLFTASRNLSSAIPSEEPQREPIVRSNTAQKTPDRESVATLADPQEASHQGHIANPSTLRAPQYGLEELALANYSHIEVPKVALHGPQLFSDDLKDGASDFQNDSEDSTIDQLMNQSKPSRSPQDHSQAAMDWHVKATEQGDAEAQFHIGSMYENGLSVAQDDAKATQWYSGIFKRPSKVMQEQRRN
ncbi:hypothetical protein BGX23_002039 [Mortierella sp. AD031]|nr:hypothetical protein BGX23_002039 [Mortierella sp. AD031]KAG0219921.1 hypothetical protein BGX33_011395 [Mortierella sp. NVP41]